MKLKIGARKEIDTKCNKGKVYDENSTKEMSKNRNEFMGKLDEFSDKLNVNNQGSFGEECFYISIRSY